MDAARGGTSRVASRFAVYGTAAKFGAPGCESASVIPDSPDTGTHSPSEFVGGGEPSGMTGIVSEKPKTAR